MYFQNFEEIPEKVLMPGIFVRMVHTDKLTVMRVKLVKGAVLPEHSHPHEQISSVQSGELEFTINGSTRLCKKGDVAVIPSNVPHSVKANTDCIVIDIFQPAREDYKKTE